MDTPDPNITQEILDEDIPCGHARTTKHFCHEARLPQWLHNRLPLRWLAYFRLTHKSLVRQDCTIYVKPGLLNPIKEGKI